MENSGDENFNEQEKLARRVDYLEFRLSQVEAMLGLQKPVESDLLKEKQAKLPDEEVFYKEESDSESVMESKIGEFGLAWLGSIVLLFGIAFITQFIQSSGQSLLSAILGYGAVAGILAASHFIRKSVSNLAEKFNIISQILLFYVTLRLHFYTAHPLFSSEFVSIILLLVIIGIQFYQSIKRKSEFSAIIASILLMITAFIITSAHFTFSLLVIASGLSIFMMFRHGWWKLLLLSQTLVYLSFVLWYFESHTAVKLISSDNFGLVYLFLCVSLFSLLTLIKQKETFPGSVVFFSVIINGILFSLNLAIFILSYYTSSFVFIFSSIALVCLSFSVGLKKYSEWKYTPAFYALYGFVAMSIAVYGICGMPLVFLLLSLQSLLVVSMAIWFKSKIIVIMNFFLFISLLAGYLFLSPSINSINISFALIALISARIINWKKERLEIQTGLLRNVYMIVGFGAVLFALYKLVPNNYVTLSWTMAAAAYFLLSIILHNIKYRWMALATMLSAAIYLFIVDLASVGILFRIVAFMVLAAISLGVSIYYTKRKAHTIDSTPNQNKSAENND